MNPGVAEFTNGRNPSLTAYAYLAKSGEAKPPPKSPLSLIDP
jgi:hypothetical protein